MERLGSPRLRLVGAIAILIVWTVLLTLQSSLWARRQFVLPPAWDHAFYLSMSLRFHRSLEGGGPRMLVREILLEPSAVAPLFPASTVPFYAILGESREVAQLALAPFLFLVLLSTALLSRSAGGTPLCVWLSAFSISTFSGVVNFSREYMMDLPAAAMATLALTLLSWRGPNLRAGFLLGVALLTKVLAGLFFVGPLLYYLVAERKRRGLLSFAAAGLATAGVWYALHFADVLHYVHHFGFGEGSLPYRSSSHPGYYFHILASQGLGWFPSAILVPSVVLLWRRVRPDTFLLVWVGSGYALLSILPNKGGERYVLALLPPLAVLGARAIASVRARLLRGLLVALALVAGTFNYVGITWRSGLSSWTHNHFRPFPHAMPLEEHELRGWPWAKVLDGLDVLRPGAPSPAEIESFIEETSALEDEAFVEAAYRRWLRREADPPGRRTYVERLAEEPRWKVVETMTRSEEFRLRPLRVLVVPDHRVFNAATLQYLAESERRSLSFERLPPTGVPWGTDAAILKQGGPQGPWPASTVSQEIVEAIESRAPAGAGFPCPDGSRILVVPMSTGDPS